MNFYQIIQSIKDNMLSNGITPPNEIIIDGKIKRFYIQGDKKGSRNGWYAVYGDNIPCGVYGSWKADNKFIWCLKSQAYMTPKQLNEHKQQIADAKKQRDIEQVTIWKQTAIIAEQRWGSYPIADPSHQYLIKKKISPFYARQWGKEIVLPIIDFGGKIWSLQYIDEKSKKRFLSNGAIKSHFIPIQYQPDNNRRILICEGFATGATLALVYPQSCVIAACYAGNLKSVAINIRAHLPRVQIIICADLDAVGLSKAKEAASAAKAVLKKPQFPLGADSSLKDFNDLFCWSLREEIAA